MWILKEAHVSQLGKGINANVFVLKQSCDVEPNTDWCQISFSSLSGLAEVVVRLDRWLEPPLSCWEVDEGGCAFVDEVQHSKGKQYLNPVSLSLLPSLHTFHSPSFIPLFFIIIIF